ncbi:MAG: argininosuccinate synthase [Deferribacterota bacterium]|nr:argininosuccinate synthase [Deferribacterota bacterium]
MDDKRVVLAYSGGLDTSVILKWLTLRGYEVIAFVADLGQNEDLSKLEDKAYSSGATKFYKVDLKDEFVKDFVYAAIKFNARYEDRYLLGTALARPVIAKGLVEVAKKEDAKYVAHGATGKGNDQVRFELSVAALAPELRVIAPWRDPEFYNNIRGRKEAIEFAEKHNIPIKATIESPWSTDENIMHISYEAGILEDPNKIPPKNMFRSTVDPKDAPDKPEEVKISFNKGEAIKLDGIEYKPFELLDKLNKIAGRNGVGRIDIVESRYVGMKSRGVYETPGGTALMVSHRELESLTLDGGLINLKDILMPRFASLVYNGYWFSPEVESLIAFVNESQKYVTGDIKLEFYKGNINIIGRESPYSLYSQKIASMDYDSGVYDQGDATGFINLHSIPLRRNAMRKKGL